MFDIVITVENVVMTGSFSEGVDLVVAGLKLDGSKGGWKRFPGLAYKLKVPAATFLFFRNGKFVCTGTKTKAKGEEAIAVMLSLLKECGLVSGGCVFECCVKNLVASVDVAGASVDMEQFTSEFGALYEPDKFPAAIYKGESSATFLVFLKGKFICSGVANEEELKRIVREFYEQLLAKGVIEHILNT